MIGLGVSLKIGINHSFGKILLEKILAGNYRFRRLNVLPECSFVEGDTNRNVGCCTKLGPAIVCTIQLVVWYCCTQVVIK